MTERRDWVLIALNTAPLDRIHLMKALFLLAARTGKPIQGFFTFVPYMYGPYSFELYDVLDSLESEGLIVPFPQANRWSDYYLTNRGRSEVPRAMSAVPTDLAKQLEGIVREIAPLDFNNLLAKVYKEAPEYAQNSVVRDRILG